MATRKSAAAKSKPSGSGRAKPNTPKASARGNAGNPVELPDGLWERIAKKAYDLWEQRGRPEGQDMQHWLEAEELVMDEIHEARE